MAISLGDNWGISGIRLLGQSVLALLIPSPRMHRPDCLFQTVIGIWGGHPNRSHLSEDLQDGLLIMVLGNGSKQG